MSDPQTPDEWFALARQHEIAAWALCDDREASAQAVFHAGMGAEAALKGYIMRKERLNIWPTRASRRDLYTHDIMSLMNIAGIPLDPRDARAPQWHVLIQWDRAQGYSPLPTPRRVSRSYVDAAFGEEGVVRWLKIQR